MQPTVVEHAPSSSSSSGVRVTLSSSLPSTHSSSSSSTLPSVASCSSLSSFNLIHDATLSSAEQQQQQQQQLFCAFPAASVGNNENFGVDSNNQIINNNGGGDDAGNVQYVAVNAAEAEQQQQPQPDEFLNDFINNFYYQLLVQASYVVASLLLVDAPAEQQQQQPTSNIQPQQQHQNFNNNADYNSSVNNNHSSLQPQQQQQQQHSVAVVGQPVPNSINQSIASHQQQQQQHQQQPPPPVLHEPQRRPSDNHIIHSNNNNSSNMAANLHGGLAQLNAAHNAGAEEIIFLGEEPQGNVAAAGVAPPPPVGAAVADAANQVLPGPLPLGHAVLFAMDNNNNNNNNVLLLPPPNAGGSNNNNNNNSVKQRSSFAGSNQASSSSSAALRSVAATARPNNFRYMPYRSLRNAANSGPNAAVQQIVCRRKALTRTIKFEYLIDSFSFFKDSRGPVHDVIESPTFPSEESQYKWKLRFIVHPRPERPSDEQCRDFVQVFLNLYDAPCDSVSVKVQLIMARSKDAIVDLSYQITRAREYRRGETWGFRRFIQREHIFNRNYGFLHEDQLRFMCNIDVQTEVEHSQHKQLTNDSTLRARPEFEESAGSSSILSAGTSSCYAAAGSARGMNAAAVVNYKRLLDSERFADCSLSADDGQSIRVHKAIIAAHSDVLANALESGMREQQNGSVRVGDVPFDVLREFVSYLYTNSCLKLEEYAEDLFVLADTHFVVALKTETRDCLMSTLDLSNAVRRLRLADMHSDTELRQSVLDFIEDNFTRLRTSDAWRELVELKPKLAAQALQYMYDRFNPLPSEESNFE